MAFVIMLLLLSWQPASAEYYRYVDKHGNVLYTDDVSNIPADQREAAKAYEESQSPAQPAPPSVEGEETHQEEQAPPTIEEDDELKALEKEKMELDSEYDDLKQQRAVLDEAKKKAVSPEQIKIYNEQIVEYNTRATALQEKYDAYDQRVRAYNDRVKAKSAHREKN